MNHDSSPHGGAMPVRLGLALLLLLLPGCASTRSPSESQILPPAASYLRTSATRPEGRELQIAVRRFSPRQGRGPQVWLIGVSHIGEPAYYQQLQALMDTHQLVLYEGVGAKLSTPARSPEDRAAAQIRQQAIDHSLQGTLAHSLGLVFQLSAMDYTRPHFRNSDLTRADLEHLMQGTDPAEGKPGSPDKAPEPSEAAEQFAILMQALDEGSWLNTVAKALLGFIESSPQMKGLARLALIEMLSGVGGDFEALAKVNPGMEGLLKVLVEARNSKVIQDLSQLVRQRRSNQQIAIFYGAAHMKDFEAKLAREFDYVPREERWLTAFGVDFKQSGIGTAEQSMIRSLIQWQLDALKAQE